MSKTPNFRNPSTNPFSLELISSLQISRESLSVRGLPLARLILVGQMRKGRVVVKGGGVEWQMGSVSLRYPVISQPQPSPYYSFSDVTQVRQRINHPHPSPPSPHLYLSFRVNRGRTRYVHLTVFDSRVILPLESSSALRPKKKDRPFYPSYLVEDCTCPLQSRESEGILNPRVRMSKDAVFFFLFIPPSRKIRYFLYMDIVYIYLIIFIFCTRHIIVILLLRIYLPVYVYIRKPCCSVDNLFKCKYELLIQAISMYNKWHDYSSKRWKNKINNSFFFFPHRSH